MSIKKIEIKNFKSFEKLDIELGKFNVLIGANASGKSNFVSIFKFLRDIRSSGLDNAVSMQGGVEYLRNISIGISENMSLKIVYDEELGGAIKRAEEGRIHIKTYETIYKFTLKFQEKGSEFKIVEDKLVQKCKFFKPNKVKKKIEEIEGEIHISISNGKIKINIMPEDAPLKEEEIFFPFLPGKEFPPHQLLISKSSFFFPHIELMFMYRDISIYDFDPKLSKKAIPIIGKAELEEDGSNLSIILKNILENEEKRRKLFNLIRDLLPFIENLAVEKFGDKSLLFKLQEKYFKNEYLPAYLISDGTINLTALIIALYFEKKPFVIIEEPERNIHPYLISKMVEIMKDASKNKQIIITTHNPEIVKYAGSENLLLVYRDKNGFSRISRPSDKKEINTFLKNEIGIEELYVQNLLEG